MDDIFIVRRVRNLSSLPAWLDRRRYDVSLYDGRSARQRNRVINLQHGQEPCGQVVCMNPNLFPDALIAVLHGQQVDSQASKSHKSSVRPTSS